MRTSSNAKRETSGKDHLVLALYIEYAGLNLTFEKEKEAYCSKDDLSHTAFGAKKGICKHQSRYTRLAKRTFTNALIITLSPIAIQFKPFVEVFHTEML